MQIISPRYILSLTLSIVLLFSAYSQDITDFEKLEVLKVKIIQAQLRKDQKTEALLRSERFHHLISKLADYTLAFEEGVILEPLIKANEKEDEIQKIAPSFYAGMAWLHHSLSLYTKSIEYRKIAMRYAKEQKLHTLLLDLRGAMAYDYFLVGRIAEAKQLMNQLMEEALKSGDENIIANSHYQLYTIYITEDYHVALKHSLASLNTNNLKDKSHRLINVGTSYLNLRILDSALHYTLNGEQIARTNNFVQQQANALHQLTTIYSQMGDYERATDAWSSVYKLEQQLNSYTSAMDLLRIQADKMSLQEELNSEKLNNQNKIKWIGFIVSLVLVVLLIVLYNRLKLIRIQKSLIEKEKQQAEKSEKIKEQFLANMSHEIRTPMHAIHGVANALLRKKHPINQDAYLHALKTSSQNLLSLLDDILDFTKIESGKLKIENVILDPCDILENIVSMLKYRANDKGLNINYHLDPEVPEKVIGDPYRLNQILVNLVGNAIKFTDKGEINLYCGVKDESGKRLLCFRVKDTGIGIPIGEQENVFKAFEQGARSRSQLLKGTGLGLSISKKLVELQGGKIWVDSSPGAGSVFTFCLPLLEIIEHQSDASVHVDMTSFANADSLKNIKVMIAEDDEFNIMVLTDDLKYYLPGVEISLATNGEEAFELFKNQEFDIILMDMQMPKVDGCESAQLIRQFEQEEKKSNSTPIIAMTANTVRSEIEKCLSAGMDDYISKPYQPERLIIKIANNLN